MTYVRQRVKHNNYCIEVIKKKRNKNYVDTDVMTRTYYYANK